MLGGTQSNTLIKQLNLALEGISAEMAHHED
jgi:hypothetical protein